MERMTEWDETNNRWYIVDSVGKWDLKEAVDRLAAYEDLGLTPDEIWAQLSTYSALLCEITHGRMSKTNYVFEDIMCVFNNAQEEECEQCNDGMAETMRKRIRNILKSIFVVTVVDYVCGEAQDPTTFLFDNEVSANECFRFFSKRDNIKLFMEKEQVFGSFMVAQEGNDG